MFHAGVVVFCSLCLRLNTSMDHNTTQLQQPQAAKAFQSENPTFFHFEFEFILNMSCYFVFE